ncbi:MAG: zinc ABC transporter substrate-binding protein [Clostridia bacterium]|nr:zinc ABC transporter substrate-binding protein [Clostridia bacterium]
MKKTIIILIIILALILNVSCALTDNQASDKIIIAVGIVPEAAFVEKVAGDLVEVVTLIPPGNSPANYQPSAKEMAKLSDAKIYFTMQMPTEEANILPKITDFNSDIIIVNLRDKSRLVYPLVTSSDPDHESADGVDPHLWLSPKRAIVMVQEIANQLSALDQGNEDIYLNNAKSYIKELENLDAQIADITSKLENRTFLIYHGSYAYFADDYQLTMIAIEIAGKKATAAEMQQVIDLAKSSGIKKVFYQEEFDDLQAKTVASEINGNVVKVAPLSFDYINSLLEFANALKE